MGFAQRKRCLVAMSLFKQTDSSAPGETWKFGMNVVITRYCWTLKLYSVDRMVECWHNMALTEWLTGILGRPLDRVGKWHHHLGRKPQMPKLLNLTQSLPRRRGRDRQSQRHSHAELDETPGDNLKDTLRQNWTHASMSLALGSGLGGWKLFPSQMCRRLLLSLFLWLN